MFDTFDAIYDGGMIAVGLGIISILKGDKKPSPLLDAIKEKRRVLERDRAEWERTFHFSKATVENIRQATANMRRIDGELIKLADDEAVLRLGGEDGH